VRRCKHCGQTLPLAAFGNHAWCIECNREYSRVRYATPGYLAYKNATQKGLTVQQVTDALATQGGVCRVCGSDDPGKRGTWCIDHDHACCSGQRACGECFRGLLCFSCNMGLGIFHDNADLLRVAAEYLEATSVQSR